MNQLHTNPTFPSQNLLACLLREHHALRLPRLTRLWDYFRNPARDGQLAQTQGLPPRLISHDATANPRRREVVIENDIGWRIQAQVDFLFGKPITLRSTAADPTLAADIDSLLREVIDTSGGPTFFQDLALLAGVYGYVDMLVRLDPPGIAIDLIDPPRALPLTSSRDYRLLDAYAIHQSLQLPQLAPTPLLSRILPRRQGLAGAALKRAILDETQVWTPDTLTIYRGPLDAPTTIQRHANPLGRIPIVHIQNLPQPFFYEGLSEVEPLIPLQDELNTRLCDRANRVTFQSFKMYLGKRIEHFVDRPVGPGQMWQTDDVNASIQEFGGDSHNPSEDAHILEIREAMDKCSGVSPVAAGIVRDRVGNLTSENALRIVLMGLIARTQRKRVTFGNGLASLCELILHAADLAGILHTTPDQRAVRIDWPNPLPDNETEDLRNAQLKLALGIPPTQILTELGYTA